MILPAPLPGFEELVSSVCRVCERPLTNPLSMRTGIGPVCARRLGIARTAEKEDQETMPRKRSAGRALESAVGDALRERLAENLGIVLEEDKAAAIETTGREIERPRIGGLIGGEPYEAEVRLDPAPEGALGATGRASIEYHPKAGDIVLTRRPDGTAEASIPKARRHHDTTEEIEWGYNGSGPADLALNILASYLPVRRGKGIKLWDGSRVSEEAWNLHQAFKAEVIAAVPFDGAIIPDDLIRRWIAKHT